jgi:hypothetical protein
MTLCLKWALGTAGPGPLSLGERANECKSTKFIRNALAILTIDVVSYHTTHTQDRGTRAREFFPEIGKQDSKNQIENQIAK